MARAVADATKARRERDEAVDKLHTSETEESLAKQELVKIRATVCFISNCLYIASDTLGLAVARAG